MAKHDEKSTSGPSPWIDKLSDLCKFANNAFSKSSFKKTSDKVLKLFEPSDALHVLHIKPEGSPDQLLRLHMFLHANISQNKGCLIIVDCKTTQNEGFNQAFWVVKQHISTPQMGIFKGSGYIWNDIILLRGPTDGMSTKNAMERVQTALHKLVKQTRTTGVIWHECSTISLLASMVRDVKHWQTSFGKAPLKAVVISSGLSMDKTHLRISSGLPDADTTKSFLSITSSLKIAVIFVDPFMMSIKRHLVFEDLVKGPEHMSTRYHNRSTLLPGFNELFPCLLPPSTYEDIMKTNMDDLAVQVYRLAAKHNNTFETNVVDLIKKHLRGPRSTWWAKRVVDQSEYSQQRCQRSVETHLLNTAVNVDAPLNFHTTALSSSLLDLGRDRGNMLTLSCEIDFSGPKLRLSHTSKEGPLIYILVAQSTRSVNKRIHDDWASMLHAIRPQDQHMCIDRAVAGHWLYMIKALHTQIDALYKAKDFSKLKHEEQLMIQGVYMAMMNGNMSQIATRTLGTTPFEWWKRKS